MQLAVGNLIGKWPLPSCQLHISVNRTAQIYLELHFCVELHTKKALQLSELTRVPIRRKAISIVER